VSNQVTQVVAAVAQVPFYPIFYVYSMTSYLSSYNTGMAELEK
jgi:hypothetical protein